MGWIVAIFLIACCAYTHRRVIAALVAGNEMPKAPKWHFWVPEDKRRDK